MVPKRITAVWKPTFPVSIRSLVIATILAVLASLPAAAIDSKAKQAILVDAGTGAVLFEKNADEAMAPSSMSKLMTVYMVFERLRDGRLSLDDKLRVSIKAWHKRGSKMYVKEKSEVRVEDLLRGIIVQSGNDACIVIAEGLAGSDEAFSLEMTLRARKLGLKNSVFKNSSGWPAPGHVMTARDVALLSKRTIEDFPEYYHYYAEKSFTYNKIRQGNRNPLLYKNMGADGLKTGHTEAAGYSLAASSVREGRRLILVINGLSSVRQRSREAERLMEWGFREFDNYPLFTAGETVTDGEVWLGDADTVPLVIEKDLVVTLPRKSRRDMKVRVVYGGPLPTPIEKGDELAKLVVTAPDTEPQEFPLVAGASVEQRGPLGRLSSLLGYLLWGALTAERAPEGQ